MTADIIPFPEHGDDDEREIFVDTLLDLRERLAKACEGKDPWEQVQITLDAARIDLLMSIIDQALDDESDEE